MSVIDDVRILLSLQCRTSHQLWEIGQVKKAEGEGKLESGDPLQSYVVCNDTEVTVAANIEDTIHSAIVSPNGTHYVVNSQEKGLSLFKIKHTPECVVEKCEISLPDHLKTCPATQLSRLSFSPKSSFLMGFFSPTGHKLQVVEGDNFVVWDLRSLQPEIIHTQRCVVDPIIVWRDDEQFRAWVTMKGPVHFYRTSQEGNSWKSPGFLSINVKPRGKVEIAPRRVMGTDDDLLFFSFSPAKEDTEAAGVLTCHLVDGTTGKILKKSQKLFPNVDGCETQWSPSGKRCLVMTSSLVDHMGENYGSVGDLWLGEFSKLLREKDNINFVKINRMVTQDAQWSAATDDFILVEGKSPSEVRFLDEEGGELQTLPLGYRNKVIWNTQGTMAAIGGHGNLAGDLSFYYLDPNERQLKEVADWREPCVVCCDWSPCGRYFFAASTWPRLTIDNQIRIFGRDGKLLFKKPFDCLVAVQWHYPPDFNYPALEPPTLGPKSGANKTPALYRRRGADGKGDELRNIAMHATTLQDDPANRGRGKVAALKKTRAAKAKADTDLPMEWRGVQDRKSSVTLLPATQTVAQPAAENTADVNASQSLEATTKPNEPTHEEPTFNSNQNIASPPVTTSDGLDDAVAPTYVPRVAAPQACDRMAPLPCENPLNGAGAAFRMPPPPPPPPPILTSSMVIPGGGIDDLNEHVNAVSHNRNDYLSDNQYGLNGVSTYPPRVTMMPAGGAEGNAAGLPEYMQGSYGASRLASYMNWPVFPGGGSFFEESSSGPPPPPPVQGNSPPPPQAHSPTAGNSPINQYGYGQRRQPYNSNGRSDMMGSYHPQVAGNCGGWNQQQQNYGQNEPENGGEKVVSLLRKILPSTATVNVSGSGNSGGATTPCGDSGENNGRDNLINLMRRAGIMSRAPVAEQPRNHPSSHLGGMVPTNAFAQAMTSSTRFPGVSNQQDSSSDIRWLYVDPKGRVQGPFFSHQMRVWWDRGYFESNLLIKREDDMSGAFRPLRECFPDPPNAFL